MHFKKLLDAGVGEGLLIYFVSPLSAADRLIVDVVTARTLPFNRRCRVADYRELPGRGSVIRITGCTLEEADSLVSAFCDQVWSGKQSLVDSINDLRARFEKVEVWARAAGITEMLEDQAADYLTAKDLVQVRTVQQAAARKLAKVALKKLGVEDLVDL
ncbi:hypothetical protein [Plesiocystis pacifica]|uniref:hypothetical protein n=1 Tax=Plesiocystis pacifica TaxID=191768 RepID=UPI0012FCC394|nr:hypothetical protein [Plesiocystis pacifica]